MFVINHTSHEIINLRNDQYIVLCKILILHNRWSYSDNIEFSAILNPDNYKVYNFMESI
jgi:hypothetical protein